MNILFFMTPKSEVDVIYEDDTFGQALEHISKHHYTTIPVINEMTGKYLGTLTQGDLLRALARNDSMPLRMFRDKPVMNIKRKRDYRAVRASADIEELFHSAMEQNFVPVVDDMDTFIGIVTRKSIMQFMMREYEGAASGRKN